MKKKGSKGEFSINTMIVVALGILVLALIIGLVMQWKTDSISLMNGVLTPPKVP